MLIVPLQAVPSQTVNVGLADQLCTLNVYQKSTGLYFDLLINNVSIVTGVICLNLTKIVRYLYLGFIGDFAFFDTQDGSDPFYTGLGSRYFLAYFSPADLGQAASPSASGALPSPIPSAPVAPTTGLLATGIFTLTPNAVQTIVACPNCTGASVVVLDPVTTDASNDMATTSYMAGSGQIFINHASNARTDRTFKYAVFSLG